jgi:pimeloyl-ACP methyl ester carboxylesterase
MAATRERSPWVDLAQQFWPLASPVGEIPDPTPAEGPDPYGDPDPEWLHIDWREHQRTVEVPTPEAEYGPSPSPQRSPGATTVNYVEMGSGSKLDLVFVHGLSGSWQNWLEQLPHFSRDHRVLALDLPGFGGTPLPPWGISIERYARLVRDFGAALGVGDCALIGNSLGGFISAEAAIHRPKWFERLVLVSAAGISHARMQREPAEAAARMAVAAAPIALRMQAAAMRRRRIRWAAFRSLVNYPLKLRSELLYEFFSNGAGAKGFLPAVSALIGYDILDRLEEVDVPTLIVWGRYDRIVPPGDAREYGRRLRNSRTVIFDNTGHLPMAERPVRFNRVLETFLAE